MGITGLSAVGERSSAARRTLEFESDGGGVAAYEFTVSGSIQQVDSGDQIRGNRAYGHVGPDRGTDTFEYTGELEGLSAAGPVNVYRDGEGIDPRSIGRPVDAVTASEFRNQFGSGTIEIRSEGDGYAVYEFSVSQSLTQVDRGDSVTENSAYGHVGPDRGVDEFEYTGDVTRFVLAGPAVVHHSPKAAGEVVLEQGGECVSLSPLSFQNQTIQEFYGVEQPQRDGFHRPSDSNTSTNLERPQTSRLFLYRGPNGLGYVIIHGSEDGPGGAASFGIRHSPRSGKLLVQDDQGDRFRCRPNCALNWSWGGDDGGDGAVYQPLADEFEVRIDPGFNDEAVPEAPDGAEVERWQVLSGDARDPDVIDLALDQPVTLRSGGC